MAPGEKYALTVGSTVVRTDLRRDVSDEGRLRPVARARRRSGRSTATASTTTGTGTGITATATPATRARISSTSRAGGSASTEHPVKISSAGGYYGPSRRRKRRTRRRRSSSTPTGRCSSSARAASSPTTKAREDRQPVLRAERLALDRRRRTKWQSYFGPKNEKGPGSDDPPAGAPLSDAGSAGESPHYQNFIDAIRANDPKLLTCDVTQGHLSSSLPHLANIAYRAGRALKFDGKSETFVNDKQADGLLTREYRKGFEIPRLDQIFETKASIESRHELILEKLSHGLDSLRQFDFDGLRTLIVSDR